jgi:hypothetical protein
MLSRTECIEGFHLEVSRIEKELYEEFLKTQEAEFLAEMQQYFVEAKQKAGGIRFEDQSLRSRIEGRVDAWIASSRADKHVNKELVRRSKEAIKITGSQNRRGEAMKEAEEASRGGALKIYRELAQKEPETYLPSRSEHAQYF